MANSTSSRWWENYLVRYFMPSVAGMAIVCWLGNWAGPDFQKLLLLPTTIDSLDTAGLIWVFLYGNLFCYVASYPILGFHVTRVLDFKEGRWLPRWIDGYVLSAILAVSTMVLTMLPSQSVRFWGAFVLVGAFAGSQLFRFRTGFKPAFLGSHLKLPANLLYAYAYRLSRRRGAEDPRTSIGANPNRGSSAGWRGEFVESYRHLREHGNSGFIFLLELVLAGLCYCIIKPKGNSLEQLSTIAVMFAIWAVPAAVVHLMGQELERRFSLFDADLLHELDVGDQRIDE